MKKNYGVPSLIRKFDKNNKVSSLRSCMFKMYKKFAVLYCVMLCATEIFGLLDFLRAVLEAEDRNITRVRTLEELQARKSENAVLDFIGLVEQYKGYTAEEYDVKTDDGYILKLHRISGSPHSPAAPGKPVVYLQHGLFGSSDFHVILGPKQALTFLLADAGYDVWLGNVRGTTYSKRHVKLSTMSNNYDFWNYSIDEMGTIDIPKFIDTVLEKTKQEKLTYIGYSMGTTVSYMLLSERPEYNSKMNLVISLAPVAFFSPPYSDLVRSLLLATPPIKALADVNRYYEILPQTKILQVVGKDVCGSEVGKVFCDTILTAIVNPKNMDFSVIPNLLAYSPAGSSLHTVYQYYQMTTTREFKKYDFGWLTNKMKYGSIRPPKYIFSKITAPQALYYGDSDVLINVKDVETLRDVLKNVVIFQQAPAGYNHLDFMWSTDVREVLYKQILDGIQKYR